MRFEDKIYSKGLRFNIWIYFLLFSLLILGLIWMLQVVLLSGYYKAMKVRDIGELGKKLADNYAFDEQSGTIKASYAALLDTAIAENSLMIVIFDEKVGTMLYSKDFFSAVKPDEVNQFGDRLLSEIKIVLDASSSSRVVSTNSSESMMTYIAKISKESGDVYFYLNSPLAPVATAVVVLKDQLMLVTVITLSLAFILSWFISFRLSIPITKMSRAAQRLARGDYSVVFEGNGYTEIDELSETLNFATSELAKTDKLRKDLIANVSHDLRTPLTMIKAYAEMIRDLSGNNAVKRALHTNVIIEETDRLTALVSDMLNLSKLESGTIPLNIKEFDLSNILQSITARFSTLFEKEGYTFENDISPDLFVRADELKIEQVIYNLIINAINYTGEDKKIRVLLQKEGAKARFSVTDTGSGIPKEEQEGIWERYYRASEARKRSSVGTGLGLSIVKNILKAHKATFGVNSELGKGSTFWFDLPLIPSGLDDKENEE